MSKYFRLGLIAVIGVSCVLLFLLVLASQNSTFFEKYYTLLLWLNTIIALVFLGLICVLLYRLYRRAQKKKYGVKILSKFALALGLTGVVPGILIFATSVQFLHTSVESWFDVRVERALDSGLTLGREVVENFQSSLRQKARTIANEISETPPANWMTVLDAARERQGLQEAVLVNSAGNFITVSASSFRSLVPSVPTNRVLQTVRTRGFWQQIDDEVGGMQKARVIVPVPSVESIASFAYRTEQPDYLKGRSSVLQAAGSETVFLEVVDNVPPSLSTNAEMLMNGYRDYQEMVLARAGLNNIYLISLTLVLLLSMFGAIALSVIMANRISQPLMMLLEGTRKVAEGKYDLIPEVKADDEVGELARSFNRMTEQLAQTQADLVRRGAELEQAKSYLERILAKMSSGVIVLNNDKKIISANSSASRILGIPLTDRLGSEFAQAIPGFASEVVEKLMAQTDERNDITLQCEYQRPENAVTKQNLFARATRLPIGDAQGYLIVFDDVTALVSAQRTEAWGEVARRLAHEIKNPLTPIQLAAERVEMKIGAKLEGRDKEILERATKTIVNQVTAMKQMVNDFRLYAKIGAPHYDKLDLKAFVEEVVKFYQAAGVHIDLFLQPGIPPIEADQNQLRQVFHNLLSNSMEAVPDKDKLVVSIRASVVTDEAGDVEGVELDVSDNGPGFTDQILEHAFEPYVTTKSSGTGLGLATIKKIAEEHGAMAAAENRKDADGNVCGARLIFVFHRLWHEQSRPN